MPRPSQENKILEAALQCFADLGYEGTRIRHIAERAGVAESALYRHYVSKEAIAQVLFQQHCSNMTQRLSEIAAANISVEARLKGFVQMALDEYREDAAAISYILIQPPAFKHLLPPDFDSPLNVIAQVIAEGQKAGEVRSGPPILIAGAFLGCFLQLFAFVHFAPFQEMQPSLITQNEQVIVEMAWAAVAQPKFI